MGTTNHGIQTITFQYHLAATGQQFTKKSINIIPRGIYKGGYLTKVTDSEVSLSTFVVEIGDNDAQITSRSASAATLNSSTLDSGAISIGTPYLIMRWTFTSQQNNYVEIHAIDSLNNAQANDIVIGKCNFSGATLVDFDYSCRTFLNVMDLFFKVEVASGLYVRLRNGKVHNGSQYVLTPDQLVGPFSVPNSPNSRIDLVYINSDGTAAIMQGTPAVGPSAPNYGGKLVVAEVLMVNGDTSIPASRINDVRSFVNLPTGTIMTSMMKKYDSGWFAVSKDNVYTKSHGLGAEPSLVLVYFAQNSDGSGWRCGGNDSCSVPEAGYAGSNMCSVDSSNIQIRTGSNAVVSIRDQNGTWIHPSSCYAKIIAIL